LLFHTQRKTGLFKKAYELGVLCSVDVAVIIFERKPGHPDKLFQYCSTDINTLVQRQIRFDGERDLRTPQDFSGGAGVSRMDDLGDDDDDGDADDSPTAQYIRQDSLKGKSDPESSQVARPKLEPPEIDYRQHLHLPGSLPTTSSSNLPISADRHTNPHASGSRATGPSSPYITQSPNPRKRPKVDEHPGTATSPALGTFTPRSDTDPSLALSSQALHSRAQPHPPPPYPPGFFPGFSSHVSPTAPPGSAGSLSVPSSFPSPTAGSSLSGHPLHMSPPYGSPRHPPRITLPHFGPSTDDLFANVFGPAGGSGVGLDPEFDFLAPPLTFEWPQFAPTTQAAGGNGQQGHAAGDSSSPSWLDYLSGPAPDTPRSPRTGKRSRGDGAGSAGEEGARGAASGSR